MDDMPNIEQNIKTKIIETGLAITSARRRCGNSSQRLRLRKQSLESWVKRNPLENICIWEVELLVRFSWCRSQKNWDEKNQTCEVNFDTRFEVDDWNSAFFFETCFTALKCRLTPCALRDWHVIGLGVALHVCLSRCWFSNLPPNCQAIGWYKAPSNPWNRMGTGRLSAVDIVCELETAS